MLYDNALLLRLYLHAWQVTGEDRYRQVIEETAAYLLRPPMRSPAGGIHSAEDADSEGVEGKFSVWSLDEVEAVGGIRRGRLVRGHEAGNWEGLNILRRPLGAELLRPPDVEAARARLFEARERRVRPGLDDKVVTEWNAMAVAALADAGVALGRPEWVGAAEEIAAFLLGALRGDPTAAGCAPGRAAGPERNLAVAVDYAWLVEAFTRLAEATGAARWITEARAAADDLLDLFWDDEDGGLFTTGHDAERLIARAEGHLRRRHPVGQLGRRRRPAAPGRPHRRSPLRRRGRRDLPAPRAPSMARQPMAFTNLLVAVDLLVGGVTEVAVTGDRADLVGAVQALLPALGRAGLGGALPLTALGGPHRAGAKRQGLRVPRLRLPGPDRRAGRPARGAGRGRGGRLIAAEPGPPTAGIHRAPGRHRPRLGSCPSPLRPTSSTVSAPCLPRRTDTPGTELELLILSVDRDHVAAVDLASGALVRAWSPGRVDRRLRTYDVVAGTLDDDHDRVPDPSEPEAIAPGRATGVDRAPLRPAGAALPPSRSSTRAISRCSAPTPRGAVLGAQGRPPVHRRRRARGARRWWPAGAGGSTAGSDGRASPCRCPSSTPGSPEGMLRTGRLRLATGRGDRLLVALTPPIDGHCHKVVVGPAPPPLALPRCAGRTHGGPGPSGGVARTPDPRPCPTRRR